MPRPLPQRLRILRVGGSVRDELLGRPVADRDYVVVGATPEIMLASGFRAVGRDFPVFLHPETQEEHALARTERKHGQGYRGFEFFASPDVTLEEDLARRDLTINAMARAEDDTLIDPFGGERDLREGILRHVSPAFAEDPLRVLRVARFAARFGFVVAPETQVLLRAIVAGNELATLSSERVWRELAQGLSEKQPSRMLGVLRECGALAQLLPEVDALFARRHRRKSRRKAADPTSPGVGDAGVALERSLDWAASRGLSLPVRYAILVQGLGAGWPVDQHTEAAAKVTTQAASVRRDVALAQRVSARLRVPQDAGDAARLAARWRRDVQRADQLAPAAIMKILSAADALRRPERLDWPVLASAAEICAQPDAPQDLPGGDALREALAAIRDVDAGRIAAEVSARYVQRKVPADSAAIAKAVRQARLAALRKRKAARRASTP